MLLDLVKKNRSFRRFQQDKSITKETLRELVNLARLSPSGGNLQPLRFGLICAQEENAKVFPALSWAGYLLNWPGPLEGERPAAYIIILGDTTITRNFGADQGIACQSILLGAAEKGLGGCIIGTVDRDALRISLRIPDRYQILLVIALGVPGETVVLEDTGLDGDIKYWRDDKGVHHVPKRPLDELIVNL